MRLKNKTKDIMLRMRNAGVVGTDKFAVPTYVKLSSKADLVIANGAESEPLLHSEKSLLYEKPGLIIDGIKIAMEATGALKAVIAVRSSEKERMSYLSALLKEEEDIDLFFLEDFYPSGDDPILVYEVTKKLIPEGKTPLDEGIVVEKLLSFAWMYQGYHGKPVTERPISVVGEVQKPQVSWFPIGTLYKDVLKSAGGTTLDLKDAVVFDGGPLQGEIVKDLNVGIGKNTSAVMVLPKDHKVSKVKMKSLEEMILQNQGVSGDSSMMEDLCPRYQLGYDIHPSEVMKSFHFPLTMKSATLSSAYLCNDCSLCEFVGSSTLNESPRLVYSEFLKGLARQGKKKPLESSKKIKKVRSNYEYNKVSCSHLTRRIQVEKYDSFNRSILPKTNPQKVRVPVTRHKGTPAQPVVVEGQSLRMGDVIAFSPPGELGTTYHASIPGRVSEVNDHWIEIIKGRNS